MDVTERSLLIRRGNELFNIKDYKNALKIFVAIGYKDGIARMASVMEHEKKDRVSALKLYKQAGMNRNVEKIAYEMAQAIRLLVKEDKAKEAAQKGQNYDSGYKVSGLAPEIISSQKLSMAKKTLGINDKKNPLFLYDKNVIPWKPIIISRDDIEKSK